MAPKSFKRRLATPKRTDSCPCGSGASFGHCCELNLPAFEIGKRAREARKNKDWSEILIATRADVTQYTIWHRTNTEPILLSGHTGFERLLKIDVEALGELTMDACRAYSELNRRDEIPATLERLRANIKHSRWQRKITCFQALMAELHGDNERARLEFSKLGEIGENEDDLDILQLYMDIDLDRMSFSQTIRICDQILSNTDRIGNILQYNGLKAFTFAAIGDSEKAKNVLAVAIVEARHRSRDEALSVRSKNFLAGLLTYQGLLASKESSFADAVALYNELLSDPTIWTEEGRASLLGQLGECHRFAGKWKEAESAYRDALSGQKSGIAKVFLAECLVRQGKTTDAINTFDAVDKSHLDRRETLDYAYVAAMIAVEDNSPERIAAAIQLLKAAEASEPYFESRRLNLIVKLHEALAKDRPAPLMHKLSDFLRTPLKTLSRYAILRPTVLGFGVNLNAVIDDAVKDRKKSGSGEKVS
ncbi:MAG: SEC-C domain-containing protein [Alphaproteobacteria bacterium]|nr:SEC-C domain-containing protein [Alphaproteobacteria bacterium]